MIEELETPSYFAAVDVADLRVESLRANVAIFGPDCAIPERLEGPPAPSPIHERIATECQAALAAGRYHEAVFQAGRCLTRFVRRPGEEQRALRALYDGLVMASRDREVRSLLTSNQYGAKEYIAFVSRLARAVEKMSRSEA